MRGEKKETNVIVTRQVNGGKGSKRGSADLQTVEGGL